MTSVIVIVIVVVIALLFLWNNTARINNIILDTASSSSSTTTSSYMIAEEHKLRDNAVNGAGASLSGSDVFADLNWISRPIDRLTSESKLIRIKSSTDIDNSVSHYDDIRQYVLNNLEEFLKVYKERPDTSNLCGIRINHSLAVWTIIKRLQPTTIIESGVNSGQSTYFFRKAAPNAKIISIDPLSKPICGQPIRWIDETNNEYLTGDKFIDFDDINWKERIANKEIIPETTLVFIDDHIGFFKRFPTIVKYGFRHIMNEDNYKKGEGATPGDKNGYAPKQMFALPNNYDTIWLFHNMKQYYEFPPLLPPIETTHPKKKAGGFLHHTDDLTYIEQPILRPDINTNDKQIMEHICTNLQLDCTAMNFESYQELMGYNFICYLEMVPLSPQLATSWKIN